jgi:hypothetical protein
MRKVTLTVMGIAGLSLLLCGSGEALAQTDRTAFPPGAPGSDAADSRTQSMTPGGGGVGTEGTAPSGTQAGGTGGSGTAAAGAGQAAGGAGASPADLRQSVLQLQSEVAQLRQELAQVRSELANANANTGVGGSGQAGVAPPAAPTGAGVGQNTQSTAAGGSSAQGTVSGGTGGQGAPLRAGTAQETAQRGAQVPADTDNAGEAVVNAIYTGKVRSVSDRQLVLLDDAGQPFTVELGPRTRFISRGQRIPAQQLKQGTRVRATVDLLSGRNQATEVTTLPER